MANPIAIVTDSTCDIPAEWIKKYEITIVPMTVVFGDAQFLDGVEMTAQQFYERLAQDPHHPTTSQPTPADFQKAYRKALESGARQILAVVISSGMSGTISSAQQAARDFPIPVQVVDSRNNSMGLGWQVLAAARARENGATLEQMVMEVENTRNKMVYYISLDTIEYLAKGGRIGGAVKFLQSVINIKPLVYVRPDTGTVGAAFPAHTRRAGLQGMYKEFFKHIDVKRPLHIAVLHNNILEDAQVIAEQVKKEYAPKELLINIVTPILGAHTGPKAVALCGYAE
jgi:DegV family protein with EDD domain